jgi:hypothetical protein
MPVLPQHRVGHMAWLLLVKLQLCIERIGKNFVSDSAIIGTLPCPEPCVTRCPSSTVTTMLNFGVSSYVPA